MLGHCSTRACSANGRVPTIPFRHGSLTSLLRFARANVPKTLSNGRSNEGRRFSLHATPDSSRLVVTPETRARVGTATESEVLDELVAWLRRELPRLFGDGGMATDRFAAKVDFEDPITRYDSLAGYLFNIAMLRALFSPTFLLHDVYVSGSSEITTRWTMRMFFRLLPWVPEVVFTGLSIYGVDLRNKQFTSHKDVWDSITDNAYFSQEGLQDLVRQLLLPYLAPARLGSPPFTVLLRRTDYEVRQYESLSAIQLQLPLPLSSPTPSPPSPVWPSQSDLVTAMRPIDEYLNGRNKSNARLSPGPILLSSSALSISPASQNSSDVTDRHPHSSQPHPATPAQWLSMLVDAGSSSQLPLPLDPSLHPFHLSPSPFIAAVASFPGPPTPQAFSQCAVQLRQQLAADTAVSRVLGSKTNSEGERERDVSQVVAGLPEGHMNYQPSSSMIPPPFQRNEVLIVLPEFSLEALE